MSGWYTHISFIQFFQSAFIDLGSECVQCQTWTLGSRSFNDLSLILQEDNSITDPALQKRIKDICACM